MISAKAFLNEAQEYGFRFYTGVPCSFLTPLINQAISSTTTDYLGATSEGEAVAIAAGAWLAGKQSVVMCQNSGLGNMINPLTSLNFAFRIPSLLICTWRGQPGLNDEPQHELMGQVMQDLLSTIQIRHCRFPIEAAVIKTALDTATESMVKSNLPFALLMEKGSVRDEGLEQSKQKQLELGIYEEWTRGRVRPTRVKTLERFLGLVPQDAVIIATTGKCGRELFALADREQHFYQVGAMGCASAIGLGVALNSERRVIVLDGDGAALMKMGNFATIGANAPQKMIHIVLDNGVHDSTGGQPTVSATVNFASVAIACGYRHAVICDNLDRFEAAFSTALAEPGPHLIHMRIAPGSMAKLGRPTVTPYNVARRFRGFLNSAAPQPVSA